MNKSKLSIIPNIVFLLTVLLILNSCEVKKPEEVEIAYESLPQVIDYNFHVRPILSDKCFACHGPDAANRKANLRLDTQEGAFKALNSGTGKAINPGKPGKSEVYLRMISEDVMRMMPPPESHLKLTPEEIAVITKWIEQGAEYKPHWAFIPPGKGEEPTVKNDDWLKTPIDKFILARLEKEGLPPSKEASKETLIRRLSFDLTGLPPTLEEIQAFVDDQSPDAYERLVDRLLASKAYGERMAANWMDVARYADSDGYLDDKLRQFTPWRDWVIHAFNKNMPYDQFITWQLAGDQIPNKTKESTLATAFNRLHKKNSEAGINFEEYRVEYVADRANTLGKGIMGISLECARCHDHKYDPISQKNYYELFGFFNSTFEIGTPVYGPGLTAGPSLLLSTIEEEKKIDELREWINRLESEQEVNAQRTNSNYQSWSSKVSTQEIEQSLSNALVASYSFDHVRPTEDGEFSMVNEVDKKRNGILIEPILKEGIKGQGFFVSDYNTAFLGGDDKVGWYDRTDPFSIQFWLYPDTLYKEVGILWHSEELRLGTKGYSVELDSNRIQFIMARAWPHNAIDLTTKQALAPKEWTQVTLTYDGSSKSEGIRVYFNGKKQEVSVAFDHLSKSILYEPDVHTYGFSGLFVGMRDKYIPFKDGGIDEIKVFDRQLSDLEVLLSYTPDQVLSKIKAKDAALLASHYALVVDEKAQEIRISLEKAREQENELISDIQEIMVMGDLPVPRPTYLLDRGSFDAPTEEVQPSTPESILPFDETYPRNRYGLTLWLFDEKNPLTSRVYVNRVWQMYFGQGLVKTSEDFGLQGSLPSHPQLLDWLASQFMDTGWDIKALHKMIVTSATYMQSSEVTPELLEKDPENILLARGARFRLPAEMIRDNALAVSGLLVNKQGGESVYPYQPEGLWDGLTTKTWAYKYLQDEGEGLYRRSLYTIWKRQAPPPSMQLFDIQNRGVCRVRRRPSSTPLQALVLLNDPQYVEASRVLAERLIKN